MTNPKKTSPQKTSPSQEDLERFRAERKQLDLLATVLKAEDERPSKIIEDDLFRLLEAAARGEPFGAVSFPTRLRLRRALGFQLEYAMLRFMRQFEIRERVEYVTERTERLRRHNHREVEALFLNRTVDLAENHGMGREEARAVAAKEAYDLAQLLFHGSERDLRKWAPVDPRALEKRYNKLAEPWERRGRMPPVMMADLRMEPAHAIEFVRGKPGRKRRKQKP